VVRVGQRNSSLRQFNNRYKRPST